MTVQEMTESGSRHITGPIRSCFPPSPTGYLHVGGARSALFDWLAARSTGGQFILRIEDTDQNRLQAHTVDAIFDGLRWLGLEWDEGPLVGGPYGPYVQSERLGLYQQWARWLLDNGHAYEDFSPPRDPGKPAAPNEGMPFRAFRDLTTEERDARRAQYEREFGRKPAVRFKLPLEGETVVEDLIRGEIRWQNSELPADPVLLKGDGFPTYHLAEAVDDHAMNRNVVMRGQEWIPSMPIHALLFRAFGWPEPVFCHLPLVNGADGKKLSKRNGDAGLHEYLEQGYLAEAIVNFCALLGWSFGDDIEIFSKEEAISRFRVEDIRPAPSMWDTQKLLWINAQWINHRLTPEDFARRSLPFLDGAGIAVADFSMEYITRALATVKDRAKLLTEVSDLTRFYFEDPAADDTMVALLKKQAGDRAVAILAACRDALQEIAWPPLAAPEGHVQAYKDAVLLAFDAIATRFDVKRGVPFGLTRIATTGGTKAPDQAELMHVLGKEKVMQRLDAALAALKAAGEA